MQYWIILHQQRNPVLFGHYATPPTQTADRRQLTVSLLGSNKFGHYQFSQICVHVIDNTPSLDNRQIAANGQFTTDSPQSSATLVTLSHTSRQVTVPWDHGHLVTVLLLDVREQTDIYSTRESEGVCFYRRWFVCLSVTTITKKIVDGFVPNFMGRNFLGEKEDQVCFFTIGRRMWK